MTASDPDQAGLQQGSSGKKIIGRPFKPGCSGNPSGKRRGCVSLAARLKKRLTVADADQIVARLIELAKGGDLPALKLIFERVDGAPGSPLAVAINNQIAAPAPVDMSQFTEEEMRAVIRLAEDREAHRGIGSNGE